MQALNTLPAFTRRDLLKGALAAPFTAHAAPAAGMFVSLNNSLLPPRVPWPEFVSLAGRIGYGGADLNLDAAMKEGVEATRKRFAAAGIRPGVAGFPIALTADDAAFQSGMTRLAEVGKFLAAVNCPRMMAVLPPAGDTPKAEMRKRLKDRLAATSATLTNSGVRLGLEFLGPVHFRVGRPHEFIWRMDETLEFAKECGPNIGLQLDAWHWHHAGATAADIISAGKSRIVSVHVSDARRQPAEEVRDNQRLLPGEGVIDLTAFFGALRKIEYTDAVSPEPLGRIPAGTSAEEGAKMGLDSTLAVMRKAGL